MGSPGAQQSRLTVAPLTRDDVYELLNIVGALEGMGARGAALVAGERSAKLSCAISRRSTPNSTGPARPCRSITAACTTPTSASIAGSSRRAPDRACSRCTTPSSRRRSATSACTSACSRATSARRCTSTTSSSRRSTKGAPTTRELAVQVNWRHAADRLSKVIAVAGERGSLVVRTCRDPATSYGPRLELLEQLACSCRSARATDAAASTGRAHGAVGLDDVPAVGEAALPRAARASPGKHWSSCSGRKRPQADLAQSRRVDDVAASRPAAGSISAPTVVWRPLFTDSLISPTRRSAPGNMRVEQRRLADAGRPGEHRPAAGRARRAAPRGRSPRLHARVVHGISGALVVVESRARRVLADEIDLVDDDARRQVVRLRR